MKHVFLILLLSAILSCGSNNNSENKSEYDVKRKPIDLEYVKKQLCFQNNFWDTIDCPDSIWTMKLKDTSLYLTQSYYGSGYGNGIWVNLISLQKYSYKILDSIYWYNIDDYFKPENIYYNDSLNCFSYIVEGGGTNAYSETKYLVRVENNRFIELISIPLFVSEMNPETSPMTCLSLTTKEISLSQKQIVLKAIFKSGFEKNGKVVPTRIKEDVVTFEYSDSSKSFLWKESTNKDFREFWLGQKDYYRL